MISTQNKIISIIFLLSFAAMFLWLSEILLVKGWHGLNWLHGELYSPYLATMFVVTCFLTPFIAGKQITKRSCILAGIILYVVSIFFYFFGEQVICIPYQRFLWSSYDYYLLYFIGFLLFPLLALSYWWVTQKFIKKTKKIHIIYILLLILAIVPLSLLSITICSGFGTGDSLIDAIKMGYPVFWTGVMLGGAGILLAKS